MPIKFRCQHCQQLLGISRLKAGEVVDCPTCGRSIRVPAPEANRDAPAEPDVDLADPRLAGALHQLARIGREPTATGGDPSIKPSASDAEILAPQPLPEPVPIEPPVPVSAEQNAPASGAPRSTGQRERSSSPRSDVVRQVAARGPHRERSPTGSDVSGGVRNALSRSGLVSLAGGVLVGFALGYLIGHAGDGSDQAARKSAPNGSAQVEPGTGAGTENGAVYGRITFKNQQGDSRPDRGARVFVFPKERNGRRKLDIVGLRAGDSAADFESAAAAFRALGGDVALVDEQGEFELSLPSAGTYPILVVSSFEPRDPDEPIRQPLLKLLAAYFDRPEQLLGRVAYQFGQVRYKGTEAVLWDHAF